MPCPLPEDLFQPRDQTHVSALYADSLPYELPGKPKNTGVDSLSLLQGIFPTQELNLGLLHCRQILYQLGYQGSQILLSIPPNTRSRTAPASLGMLSLVMATPSWHNSQASCASPCLGQSLLSHWPFPTPLCAVASTSPAKNLAFSEYPQDS